MVEAQPLDAPAQWWLEAPAATSGLTQTQAEAALAQYGANRFESRQAKPLLVQFAARFRNPLVLILLVASAVSAMTGDLSNFAIIITMVVLSVAMDFFQEHRAGRAADQLRDSVALRTQVERDGKAQAVAVADVVPGDIVRLSAGDRVPADGVLLDARDFFVNQALLTGESYPVEKRPGIDSAHEAGNAVFMGSTVVSGSARVLVRLTGRRTALGAVAHSILADPPPTAFEIGTQRFGSMIMRLTLLLVLFVLLVNVWLDRPLIDSFLFAVALAVGLTPELLPMVISVTLSRGAMRMATLRVIVKRLPAIQNLGAMDVLCTDKTGTLTEANIRLDHCVDAEHRDTGRVLTLAHLNSRFESGLKSPLDDAVLACGTDDGGWTKVDEVPFDFERRRVSVLLERAGQRCLVVKGAPDDVLKLCSHYEVSGGQARVLLDDATRERLHDDCRALEREGLRVLGVASRDMQSTQSHVVVGDESGMAFAGFAAFIDPPKPGAAEALAALARSGVEVKIVSGDSELVTQHLCALLKLPVRGVLTGSELAQMDETTLRTRAGQTTLFCRVNPAQKNRIVLALKARGHVVGYLGDGVNDAPPLRSADVGITVDSAVDVAREMADLVMLDHDLAVLHEGVLEGRRTFGNVMKYIMMGTSSNFGNMFSMAGASIFLPFLPMLPTQILVNNFLYDLAQITIPTDNVDEAFIQKPHHWDIKLIRRFMFWIGPLSSIYDFLTFYVLLKVFRAGEKEFHTGWFVESLATQTLVIFVIRTFGNPLRSRASVALSVTALGVVLIGAALPFTPLAGVLGFVLLPPLYFVFLAGATLTYLVLVEAVKRRLFGRAMS